MLPSELVRTEQPVGSYHVEDRPSRRYAAQGRFWNQVRLTPRTWFSLAIVAGVLLAVATLAIAMSIF
jgi:uncharacterized membrane protein YdfJ with MMPL/SSD domain